MLLCRKNIWYYCRFVTSLKNYNSKLMATEYYLTELNIWGFIVLEQCLQKFKILISREISKF